MSSTTPEMATFHCHVFSYWKKFIPHSWRLKHMKLHHPEHHQVAHQENLTIRSEPEAFNLLSIVNSRRTKIQSMTWTCFPNSNTLETSHTRSLNHRHPLCHRHRHTPAPALHWVITSLSHWNATSRVTLREFDRTIPTIHLWCVKSTNTSSVGSWRREWRRTMTTYWTNKTPLYVSHDSQMRMVSRSFWLAAQMIRLSGEWKLQTLKAVRSNDKHQRPIKYWSRDIIKSMRWLMRQPDCTEHLLYTPQSSFKSDKPPKCLYTEMHTTEWWWAIPVRRDTQGL